METGTKTVQATIGLMPTSNPDGDTFAIITHAMDVADRTVRFMTLRQLAFALRIDDFCDYRAWFDFRCRQFGFVCDRDWFDRIGDFNGEADPAIGLDMAKVLAAAEHKRPRGLAVYRAIIDHERRLRELPQRGLCCTTVNDPAYPDGLVCLNGLHARNELTRERIPSTGLVSPAAASVESPASAASPTSPTSQDAA